jgi:hypothetical protein
MRAMAAFDMSGQPSAAQTPADFATSSPGVLGRSNAPVGLGFSGRTD